MNKRGQTGTELLVVVLFIGLAFGGLGGAKLSNLNPFKKSANVATTKAEGTKEEYFKDKVKGIEYTLKETHETQNKDVSGASGVYPPTIGGFVGNFIDKSIRFLIFAIIVLAILSWITGKNLFKKVRNAIEEAKKWKKVAVQTVKGVETAKTKMNGEKEILKVSLKDTQDEDVKEAVRKIKNLEN